MRELFGSRGPTSSSSAPTLVSNFLEVPLKFERVQFVGILVCTDILLFAFTHLPMRFFYALFMIPLEITVFIVNGFLWRGQYLKPTHIYDIFYSFLLIFGGSLIMVLDFEVIYGYIAAKDQKMLKLYTIFFMADVLDILLLKLGTTLLDACDSLFWRAGSVSSYFRLLQYYILTHIYVVLHTTVIFIHIATLLAAILNDTENATSLIAVLISSNFKELTSHVFKKMNKESLFNLVCNEITERFRLLVFIICMMMRGIVDHEMKVLEFRHELYLYALILAIEMITDNVKHCFINISCELSASLYDQYLDKFASDIFSFHVEKDQVDHTYAVNRSIGLAQVRTHPNPTSQSLIPTRHSPLPTHTPHFTLPTTDCP